MSSNRAVLVAASLLSTVSSVAGPIVAQQPELSGFGSELTVSRVGMVVQPQQSWGSHPGPAVVRVLEAGQARRVEKLEPLRPADQWQVLIYVDIPLSDHETVLAATGALEDIAPRLTSLGPVRLVAADPQPQQRLAPTREPREVKRALTEVAFGPMGVHEIVQLRARLSRLTVESPELVGEQAQALLQTEIETVLRQVDRLVGFVAGGCPVGPCALFLVVDGFSEQPAAFYSEASGREDLSSQTLAPVAEHLGSILSAYGWTVFPLPLRDRTSHRAPTSSVSELERWEESVIEREQDEILRPQARLGRGRERALAFEAVEVLLLPMVAPLRRIAHSTGGTVIRAPSHLDSVSRALYSRFWLWYERPSGMEGEPLVPVEVHTVEDASPVLAPRWALASTPQDVIRARLGALLEGWGEAGTNQLEAVVEEETAGDGVRRLALVVEGLPEGSGSATRTKREDTRVSLAYLDATSQTLTVIDPSDSVPGAGWPMSIEVSLPEDVTSCALALDVPSSGAWGASVIDLAQRREEPTDRK